MKEIKYGKLIEGRLYAFPGFVFDGPRVTYNPPEELILSHGYKKVAFYNSSTPLCGRKLYWVEDDHTIIQEVQGNGPSMDPIKNLFRNYQEKKNQFRLIEVALQQIEEYKKYRISEMRESSPLSALLYDYLVEQLPEASFDDIVSLLWFEDEKHGELTAYGNDVFTIPPIENALKKQNRIGMTPFYIIAPFLHAKYRIDDYDRFQCKMIFCYLHSLFDDFLISTIKLIATLHPQGAELNITIPSKDILGCYDIDEIKEQMIQRKIEALGYECYQEKLEFLRKRGVELSLSEDVYLDDMILFSEIRNILVHNAGIVNIRFLSRIIKTKYKDEYQVGETIILTHEYMTQVLTNVGAVCDELFTIVVDKFHY